MGLLDAMAVLEEEWDDVLSYLEAGQVTRLRELVAQFVEEDDSAASADIAEHMMTLLLESLPVTHPVLRALVSPEDRLRDPRGLAGDQAWFRLAEPLKVRLEATKPSARPQRQGLDGYPHETPGSAPTEIAVDIYLDTNDRVVAARVFDAADSLARLLGYDGPFDEQIVHGSIFRRAKAVAREAVTSQELTARLVTIERALELKYLGLNQAESDVREAEAASLLIGSLAEVQQACLRVGSLLVVKYQDAGGPVVLTRNLSQLELHALERFPEIQKNPRQTLDAIATAVALSHLDEIN